MSKEELIEAYKELLCQCITLEATVAEKNLIIKKYNFDRFVSKRDNAYREKEEKANADGAKTETDGGDKPKSRHTGRPAGSTNFSQVDLEAASRKNPTITLDPLEGLPEDEKGRYYIVSNGQTYMQEYCEAMLSVYKVVRPVYKKKGTENEFLSEPSHAPARNCIAGPGLLADILMMKYGFGVPHYRYVSWFSDAGFPIDTHTLYRWTSAACDAMLPLYGLYKVNMNTYNS